MSNVPNMLSLSRLPIAMIILWAAATHQWRLAFWLIVAGLATDWLDGYVATRYQASSKLGAEVLEPMCDLALQLSATIGLVLGGVIGWCLIVLMVAIAVPVQYANSFLDSSSWAWRFGYGFMPLYYLALMVLVVAIYAWLAYSAVFGWILVAGLVVIAASAYAKRERLYEWTHSGRKLAA